MNFPISDSSPSTPDKLFLWNPDGKYLDYHYPNPNARHYVGPEKFLGQYIQEVLPTEVGHLVFSTLRVAWLSRQSQICHTQLPLSGIPHRVFIQFFPMHHYIVGWVRDLPLPSSFN